LITDQLSEDRGVLEALLLEREGKLIAYIYPDYDFLNVELKLLEIEPNQAQERLERYFDNLIKETNRRLPTFSQIKGFNIVEKEFEKTPTQKIKRYIYK